MTNPQKRSTSARPPFRICLFLSDLSGGGAERTLVNVASWLANQNRVEARLICLEKKGPLVAELPPHLSVEELGASGVLAGIAGLGRQLRHSQADVLLTTQLHNNLAAVLARRLWAPRCKLILRESNTPSLHNRPSAEPWLKKMRKRLATLVSGPLYRMADGYVAVSEGVRGDMAGYYRVEPDRIRVIPNPVTGPDLEQKMLEPLQWDPPEGWEEILPPDEQRLKPLQGAIDTSSGEASGAGRVDHAGNAGTPAGPVAGNGGEDSAGASESTASAEPASRPRLVVTAGRVTRQKGHDLLIEAFARAWNRARKMDPPRRLKLIILGHYEPDDPWYLHLRTLVSRRGIEDEVTWAGYQPNPFPFFRMADLFVLSSRREGLPGALIQALACGTPAVSTDCPSGPSEILEQGRWGELVPPGDSRAMAEAICRTLTDPVQPEVLMERAAYWSSPVRAAQYLAYMEEVAGR